MFSLLKRLNRSRLDSAQLSDAPAIGFCPVSAGDVASSLLAQLARNGRFMGALDMRMGYHVKTMPDGSEVAISAQTLTKAIINEGSVVLNCDEVDPCRVATEALEGAISKHLGTAPDWSISQEEDGAVWAAQVPIKGAVVLAVECREQPAQPMAINTANTGTTVTLNVRSLN